MCVELYAQDGIAVIAIRGVVDFQNSGSVAEAMQKAAGEHDRIVVDCRELEFISSSGLRAVMLLMKAMGKRGGRLVFCGGSPVVMQVLEVTGIRKLMIHSPDFDEALQQAGGEGSATATAPLAH
jgi:anti-anti-sigma factor